MQIVLDGETFEVRESTERPGQYHCDWVTGPNPGYGFTCAFGRAQMEGTEPPPFDLHAALEQAMRDFLRHIDPETGYLGG